MKKMRLIDAEEMKNELLWGNVYLSDNETNTLVELIDNQPTIDPAAQPSRWIPVTERMPEDDIPQGRKMVTVLVCSEARRVQIASRVYWPEKDEWRWSKMMNNYVTHWMPLPDPPKATIK